MKTIKSIIITAVALVFMMPMVAQEQYLHIYKGGTREKSYLLSSIDSMLIDETIAGSYMDLYNRGHKHRVGNIANIDEFRVGEAVLPSGIYMGVMGFNSQLYTKSISSLSSTTKSSFTTFVNNLTSSKGTLLYYGVENALDALKTAAVPEDLLNVTLVTFTDGLDQGSFMMQSTYTSNDAYLTALNNRIKNEKKQNVSINAYSIGLRGNDVSDVAQFQKNLQYLASSEENAVEVSDISEVNAKFQEIANDVYNESLSNTVGLTIPGQSDGTKIRFTFDNVSNATNSTMYIEGTFRLRDRALVDVTYHGVSCSSGNVIVGEQDGIFITFTFEEVKSLTSRTISASNIDQWSYVASSGNWQINSEFTPESDTKMEVTRKSALIMLVLDCSSSLGSQFSTVKTQANNFISTLAGYGNDEGFSSIDISNTDIFSNLEKDEMVYVKGGTFTMGATSEQGTSDPEDDEYPTHQVTVSDFYIGKFEVTQELWEYVMAYSGTCADGSTMSAYASDVWLGDNPSSEYGEGDYFPAYYVSWNDIVNIFIPRLNKITGKTFRLPTEAEWEYAARGGNKSQGYKYSGSNTIGDVAWYEDNSSSKTHEVGTKSPNELGIYDMSGNVWEWCSDWKGSYSSSSQSNPTGPYSGSSRVRRGGSWFNYASICRVSFRHHSAPDDRYSSFGFRLVCSGGTDSPSEEVLPPPSFSTENGFALLEKDEMAFVKGGTFTMGATSEQGNYSSDERPTHQVTVSDFYIGKFEVTQELWEYVMAYSGTCADGSTMSAYALDVWLGDNPSSNEGEGKYYPAYYVSWEDIVNIFIPRLNKITGKAFRLPTEAEWEYAARGGNKRKGYKYSGSNTIGDVAWYSVNAYDDGLGSPNYGSHQVGTKAPNELGLYDMSGNVWEWCSDWYDENYYSSSPSTNPTGPSSGSRRVLRGGSWTLGDWSSRVSNRDHDEQDCRGHKHGFRLVCSIDGNNSGGTDSPSEEVLPPSSFLAENGFMSLEKDEMLFVEGGTFTMGATSEQGSDYSSDERPTHQVTVSDFYIGKYEVTQQLWEYVMKYSGQCADGSTMSAYASDVWLGTNPSSSYGIGDYYPACYVNWDDIVNIFIPRLNKITGKTFRLPTEAEWEYAARGGNKSQGYKYSGSNTIGNVAWYYDNAYNDGSHEVGTKAPNELGIYDMSGSVWEWCSDRYSSSYYSSSPSTNPTGPSSGSDRVYRGGAWYSVADRCRVSNRSGSYDPSTRDPGLGFRLVMP